MLCFSSQLATDYSLLRRWCLKHNLFEFAAAQYAKLRHHMFEAIEMESEVLFQRVFFPRPPSFLSQAALQQGELKGFTKVTPFPAIHESLKP
jgi:hypothetical protein